MRLERDPQRPDGRRAIESAANLREWGVFRRRRDFRHRISSGWIMECERYVDYNSVLGGCDGDGGKLLAATHHGGRDRDGYFLSDRRHAGDYGSFAKYAGGGRADHSDDSWLAFRHEYSAGFVELAE
jgi:hypothetical protein